MPNFYARRRLSVLAGPVATTALFNSPTASAALPTPIAGSTARSYLSRLTQSP
ncbi:hypothetical protein [Streptomyces griseofuscus]|uniref:hypothetical protein n=1 Tax=Streptomyces griseofuscus TaxID=146922 RepID=UPI00155A5DD7|nr:hypothetical protein [Streptomyces griseofuscus]